MDNSPLNKAHREQRRAEACWRGGRLEEGAECHKRAADLLTQALTLTSTPLARQSITLQHQYHLRQQEVLRFRSKQIEKYAKAMENHRLKMGSGSGSNIGGSGSGSKESLSVLSGRRVQALSLEMTKNTEKMDSLLSLLLPENAIIEDEEKRQQEENDIPIDTKDSGASSEKEKDKNSISTDSSAKLQESNEVSPIGTKKEKDSMEIVEELRTLRDHQADLIAQLMSELSQMERENMQLKNQVRELQTKCEQYEGEKRRMRAMADSSCSPFVFSPLSEFSPDPPSFPDLAPLEMPPLDFIDNYDKES
ncbi:Nuclear receptor binding factor [Halocaridina rubra]|uniref:Nuclear receptor binding factor n=1 Tax=Halocaridina rubra TaxID=373956 RepID=A0AAN8ZVZ9_HALRR